MAEPLIKLADGWEPKARAVPGSFWDRDERGYFLDPAALTPRDATVALILFPELSLTYPILAETRDLMALDVRPFDNATEFNQPIEASRIRAALAAQDQAMFPYQEIDLGYVNAILLEHGGAYIGWERGMGKTLGALSIVDEQDLDSVLIVSPNTAKVPVWYDECERFLGEDYLIKVLPNVKKYRERCIEEVTELKRDGAKVLFIVHWESLDIIAKMRKNKRGWMGMGEWDLIVADEVHRAKSIKASRTRALKRIPTRMKLALSGSMIENHAEELFSPLQWLFPKIYRSKWRDWNDRFLDYVENGYGTICVGIKNERLQAMRDELGVFMVYRRRRDELDLPPRTDHDLFVDLNPKQEHAYNHLIQTCMTELDDGTFVAAEDGLPMLGKLRQIATGLDLLGDVEDSTKLDLAVELITDSPDDDFVVFCWYKASARAMVDRLEAQGIEALLHSGDVKQDDRTEVLRRFKGGEGRVLVGTIETMGESVNLQRANQAIFLDRHWNPAKNIQAEDRIDRQGQTRSITVTHIIARGTVDEYRVMPTIANKEALRRMILGG